MGDRNRSDLLGRRGDPANEENSGGLPHPWEKHFDDEYQSYYYFNPETQETQWAAVDDQAPFVPTERHFDDNERYDVSEPYEFGDEYSLNELDGDASVSNMSRLSQLSVIERSEHMLAVKREKQENLRQQLLQREEEELRDPEINKRSKQLNRNVDDIFAWEEQRKARMEALAAQQRAAEAAQNTGRPILYASSSASVSSHNSSDSAAHLPVEARLLAYEEKRKLKLQQTIAQEKNEARRAANPTIAPHSSNLVQRRVAAVARGEEAPQLSNRRIAAGDTPGILKDNATGQTYFQPKLNRKSEQIASQTRPSNVPIEDLLVGKGRLLQQKQAERERRMDQKAQELRQVSKVNPRSELLVQERYILQGETTQDRLARPIGTVKQRTLEEIERPSFKPTLNPVSIEMTMNNGYNVYGVDPRGNNNNGGSGDGPYSPQDEALARFNSMYTSDDYSVDHSEPLLYEDLIRGKHNSNSYSNSNNNYTSYMYDSSQSLAPQDAMYSKTQRWSEMRNQKLEKERRERERKEAEVCTFKPKIEASSRTNRGGSSSHNNSFSLNNGHNSNNNNGSYYQDDDTEGGGGSIDAYLERQLTWVEKRDQKLEQERRKAAEKELADCSFAPKLIVNPNITVTSASIVARAGTGGTSAGNNGGSGSNVKPTNTTFGSNIYTTNSNTPAGVQNVRRGGAAVARVAYNASRARGNGIGNGNGTNYNDEGPFYSSDEPAVARTNKYYTATEYDEQSDEDVPPPPTSTSTANTTSEHSGGRIPLPLPAKVPIGRQSTQLHSTPSNAAQYHNQHYQPEYHQYQQYPQDQEQGEEEEQYAPPRIKVPLPAKAFPAASSSNNNGTNNTYATNTMSPNTYRKNVHFSTHNEEQHYNTHATHTHHQDQYQDGDYGGYDHEQGPHEVTIDYGSGEGSGYGSGSAEGEGGGEDVDSDCYDESRYNGLPFQVSNGNRGGGNGSAGSGLSAMSGSPGSPTGGSLSHQLFPPTPHHQQQQHVQGGRPAPYATTNTNSTSAAGKIRIGARTNHTFVEPAEDEYANASLFDVSHVSPPTHTTQGGGGSGGKPQRPAAPPAHLRGAQPFHHPNASTTTKAHSPLSSHRLYEDPDAPPPPPPPMVFQPSQPRTSSNASVVITGRNSSAGDGSGGVGTPFGAASRGVDQLRSPEEDWYSHNDDEY